MTAPILAEPIGPGQQQLNQQVRSITEPTGQGGRQKKFTENITII